VALGDAAHQRAAAGHRREHRDDRSNRLRDEQSRARVAGRRGDEAVRSAAAAKPPPEPPRERAGRSGRDRHQHRPEADATLGQRGRERGTGGTVAKVGANRPAAKDPAVTVR
jgi:hypothetical protein